MIVAVFLLGYALVQIIALLPRQTPRGPVYADRAMPRIIVWFIVVILIVLLAFVRHEVSF